jgi:hypothetical protein
MANNQNLKPPWKPGHEGNPNKGKTGPQARTKLKNLLMATIQYKNHVTEEMQEAPVADFLATALVNRGLEGNVQAIATIYDHAEGRLVNKTQDVPDTEPESDIEPMSYEHAFLLKYGIDEWARQFGKKPGDMLPKLNPDGTPKPVEMKPVQSSNVKSVGYDPEKKALHIHFRSGTTYVYKDVPESVYWELLESQSVGKYLDKNVKGGFDHEQVE